MQNTQRLGGWLQLIIFRGENVELNVFFEIHMIKNKNNNIEKNCFFFRSTSGRLYANWGEVKPWSRRRKKPIKSADTDLLNPISAGESNDHGQ